MSNGMNADLNAVNHYEMPRVEPLMDAFPELTAFLNSTYYDQKKDW